MSIHDPAFEEAIAFVLQNEGGYVDHPADPGGATNHGVSLRFLRSLKVAEGDINLDGSVTKADIQALTVDGAKALYRQHWWERYRYTELPEPIQAKLLDLAIWMGPGRAHQLLQQALWATGVKVKIDGVLGPRTRAAVLQAEVVALLPSLRSEAGGYIRSLAIRRSSFGAFISGWVTRAYL